MIIDSAVEHDALLVQDLQSLQQSGRDLSYVVLRADANGVDQIRDILADYTNLDAIHIVSHGSGGMVKLGDAWFSAANLNTDSLRGWGEALGEDADILFYGCDVASTAVGQEFLRETGSLTGADVSASINATGHSSFGGDWTLEFSTGAVEASSLFSGQAQQGWLHLLATPTAVNDSFVINEDNTLNVAAPGVLANDSDLDGDPLGAILVNGPSNGALTLNADGSFSYTPNADFNGNDSFTYRASDGTTTSNVATVSIVVNPVNDVPVAVGDTYNTIILLPMTIGSPGVLGNDLDVDGDAISAVLVSSTSNGSLSFNSNGSFTYTPDLLFSGTDSFTYRATDLVGNSNVATVFINVTLLNAPPNAVNDRYTLPEDTTLNVAAPGVLSNDSDGEPMTAFLVTGTTNGSLTFNADGSFTYTPNAGFFGSDSFTYRATDGSLVSAPATVTLTVTAVNDPPTAVDDSYAIAEDGTLAIAASGVLGNDTDPENSPLSAVLVSGPANGFLTLNADGSFTYTPNANFNGSDSFTYRASDGLLQSNLATVTLTVTAVNDPPTVVNDSYLVSEDGTLSLAASGVLANDSDVEGNSLSALLVAGPANGLLVFNADGSFTYTPNANFNGSDSFTYRATDGTATSSIASVAITVTPVNDAPVANDDSYSLNEDVTLNLPVRGNDTDIDGDPLTTLLVSGPANGTLTLNGDGSFDYTPFLNYFGSDSFTYRVSDGTIASNVATVTLTIASINDAPVNAVPGAQTIPGGAAYLFRPANGNAVSVSDVDALGTDLFQVTLTVTNGRVQVNNLAGVTIVAGASNSPTLTMEGSLDDINSVLQRVKYKPNSGYTGSATLTIQTNDMGHTGGGGPAFGTDVIQITIIPNTDPILDLDANNSSGVSGSGYRARYVGTALSIADADAIITDSSSPTLEKITITITNLLDGANEVLSVDTSGTEIIASYSNGVLTLSDIDTLANYEAVLRTVQYHNLSAVPTGTGRSISVVVNDGNSDSNVATALISFNAGPVAADDGYAVDSGSTLSVSANGTLANDADGDGDPLTGLLITGPANGNLNFNADGSFQYTPNPGFEGSDGFVYRASDGYLASNTASVTITVNAAVGTPPVAPPPPVALPPAVVLPPPTPAPTPTPVAPTPPITTPPAVTPPTVAIPTEGTPTAVAPAASPDSRSDNSQSGSAPANSNVLTLATDQANPRMAAFVMSAPTVSYVGGDLGVELRRGSFSALAITASPVDPAYTRIDAGDFVPELSGIRYDSIVYRPPIIASYATPFVAEDFSLASVYGLLDGLFGSASLLGYASPAADFAVATGLVSASGYLLLNTRVGLWLLSLLASRPVWKRFDPLEILYAWENTRKTYADDEDESLVSMVE